MFGYIFFLFYIGVKTDMSTVHRTRKKATAIGSVALAAPFLCGIAVLRFHSSKYLNEDQDKYLGVVIGMVSLTPFPVISSVLNDLKILNSELGRLGLSSALVSEMLSVVSLAIMNAAEILIRYGQLRALVCLAAAVFFGCLLVFILRPAMFWIIKQTPEGSPVSDHYVYCILIIALFSSYASHRFGFNALFGPYMLGLAVPEGPPLGTAIIKRIDTFANGVLMPLFVTTCAMRVDLKDLMNWRDKVDGEVDHLLIQTMVIMVVTFAAKFVACMLPPLYSRMPLNDAISLSLIMSCKGIVDMATYSFVTNSYVSISFHMSLGKNKWKKLRSSFFYPFHLLIKSKNDIWIVFF